MHKKIIAIMIVIGMALSFLTVWYLGEKETNKEIKIPDKTLEGIIRGKIGKRNGEPIYKSDLKVITSIGAPEEGIKSLEGLQYCVNLRVAELWNNKISYIPDLSDLDNLEYLQLNGNFISDISGLSGLESLEYLDLSANDFISDISPVSNLTNLEYLDLGRNNISDISPLANLTNLKELWLGSNDISDISPLSDLTNLTILVLYENNISDISPLSDLVNLEQLYLESNNISDISPLIQNPGINEGDVVAIAENPLNSQSIELYIPELEKRGVTIIWEGKTFYMTLHIEKVEEIPEYFVGITEEDLDNCLLLREIFEEMEDARKESTDREIEQSTVDQILHCLTSKYMEKYDLPMIGERRTVKYRGTFYLVELREE